MKNNTKYCLLAFLLLGGSIAFADENVIDLSKIQHFSPKGRIQDKQYNHDQPVVDALLKKRINVFLF